MPDPIFLGNDALQWTYCYDTTIDYEIVKNHSIIQRIV